MADNFTQFSTELTLPEEVLTYFLRLARGVHYVVEHEWPPTLDEAALCEEEYAATEEAKDAEEPPWAADEIREVYAVFTDGRIDPDGNGFEYSRMQPDGHGSENLCLYADGGGDNLELLALVLHHTFRKFPQHKLAMRLTWANTCSELRPDQFSGGWFVVTAREILWSSSGHPELLTATARLSKGE